MSRQQIDKFTYSLDLPPLHLEPLNKNTRQDSLSISDYIATSATRRFFGMLEKYRSQKKLHLITQNKVLDSGEVVGEFCMCYIQTLHQRRQIKATSSSSSSSSSLVEQSESEAVRQRKRIPDDIKSSQRKRRKTKCDDDSDDRMEGLDLIDSAPRKRSQRST